MAVVLGMSACGGYTVGFMWVLGTQYSQIAGFKIDDHTGNLTDTVGSPYSSGGANPVSIAVRVGGNFVYVVNKGTVNSSGVSNGDGNVAVFQVGEDGILTYQESYSTQGNTPVWAATDQTGSFLYVLDQVAPPATAKNPLDGDITVFSIDGNTGRLQLVPNQLIKIPQGQPNAGQQLTYFEVGNEANQSNPKVLPMLRFVGSCIYTLDTGDETIFPYGVGSSGQLVLEPISSIPTTGTNVTSINVGGANIYLTDAAPVAASGSTAASPGGRILPFTEGINCGLNVQADGAVANLPLTSDPVYILSESKGKFLYVVNHGNGSNSNNANSTISAFLIQSTGQLTPISDVSNPYPVGNGPVCMLEDPSNQYVYTSNMNDGTVTGMVINQNTGQLSGLSRGSSFPGVGLASCMAVSGTVD
jgi:6-phosphogluconolactonase (cycloisomerase 2 family)